MSWGIGDRVGVAVSAGTIATFNSRRPGPVPSLVLDFAGTGTLDSRITFTRSTTARYYDQSTVALAEQNLVFPSQAFSTWANSGVTVVDNTTTAPDGTTTGASLTQGSGTSYRANSPSITTGLAYTFSFYAKAFSTNYIQIVGGSSGFDGNTWANFDLSLGVVGSKGSSATSTITSVGSGWYRCTMTATSTATGSSNSFALSVIETATTGRFGGVVTSGSVYVWGAQAEQRSSVTAYNVTTTAIVQNYIPQLMTAAINAARFDYNPTTRVALGLLIEQSSTNLLTYSQDFSNASWTKSQSSITTTANIAPDGTQTAQVLVEATTGVIHYVGYPITTSAGSNTLSVYAKAYGRSKFELAATTDNYGLTFDLSAGTTSAPTYVGLTATGTITSVGNGWYRCTMTWTATASATALRIVLNNGSTTSYTGNGYSGVYLWGAQLEALAFATSYIPTTTAQVTRAKDVASITGANFTSWYNIGPGSFYMDFKSIYSSSSSPATTLIGLGNLGTVLYTNNGGNGIYTYDGTSASSLTAVPFGTRLQLGLSYGLAGKQLTYNGGAVQTSTYNSSFATLTNLYLGNTNAGNAQANGWIAKLFYYPTQLSSAQLQAITT